MIAKGHRLRNLTCSKKAERAERAQRAERAEIAQRAKRATLRVHYRVGNFVRSEDEESAVYRA